MLVLAESRYTISLRLVNSANGTARWMPVDGATTNVDIGSEGPKELVLRFDRERMRAGVR